MPIALHGTVCQHALSYLAFIFQGSWQKVLGFPLTPNSGSFFIERALTASASRARAASARRSVRRSW